MKDQSKCYKYIQQGSKSPENFLCQSLLVFCKLYPTQKLPTYLTEISNCQVHSCKLLPYWFSQVEAQRAASPDSNAQKYTCKFKYSILIIISLSPNILIVQFKQNVTMSVRNYPENGTCSYVRETWQQDLIGNNLCLLQIHLFHLVSQLAEGSAHSEAPHTFLLLIHCNLRRNRPQIHLGEENSLKITHSSKNVSKLSLEIN